MTDLKPSTEGGARKPTGPSEPRPAKPASPITPTQATTAKPAPIRPAQPRSAQGAPTKPSPSSATQPAPIRPAQPRTVQAMPIKPAQPRPAQSAPIKPAQPRTAQSAPIKPAQPRPAQAPPTKPNLATRKSGAPIKPAQANGHQTAAPTKAGQAADTKAAAPANAQPATTEPVPPASNTGLASLPATTPTKPADAKAPAKPDPTDARTAAPTKPAQANTIEDIVLIDLSPAATRPTLPAKPAQLSAAEAHASAQPDLADTQTAEALIRAAMAKSHAPTSPSSAETAIPAAPAKAGPATPHAATPLIKPSPADTQPAPSTKPAKQRRRWLARSRSDTEAATSTKPGPAKAEPPKGTEAAQTASTQTPAQTKPAPVAVIAGPAATGAPAAPTVPPESPEPSAPTKPEPAVTAPPKPGPANAPAVAPSESSPSSAPAADPRTPSPPKAEPAAKPSKSGRVLAVALASVAATLVAVLAIAAIFVNQVERSLTENLDREDLMPTDTASHPTKEQVAGSALNFVIMGYDSRDPSVERSSSLMILHLNAKRDQAYFITFPRDTRVSIPGHDDNKISAAYSLGGSRLAVSTLENLTDTKMDHAARADIQGFAKLTDEVGGVTVYNKTAFDSHGFHYSKGNIRVSGPQAIYFVGGRNSLPRGDFDRAANERNLVRAIIAKTLSAKTMKDPGRLFSVVSGAAEHLTVDKGLTNSKIRSTIFALRLSNKDVHLMNAPVTSKATKNGKRIVIDKKKMGELRTAMRNDRVNEYLAKYPQG
jgi:polyisoprenyl-teichoic acid--peptidoglycan teichoic acid transferase